MAIEGIEDPVEARRAVARWLLQAARREFEKEGSPFRGDAKACLRHAAFQIMEGLKSGEALAAEALDLPAWRHDGPPDWDEAIRIAGER